MLTGLFHEVTGTWPICCSFVRWLWALGGHTQHERVMLTIRQELANEEHNFDADLSHPNSVIMQSMSSCDAPQVCCILPNAVPQQRCVTCVTPYFQGPPVTWERVQNNVEMLARCLCLLCQALSSPVRQRGTHSRKTSVKDMCPRERLSFSSLSRERSANASK